MAETLWCEPDRSKWTGVRPGLYGEQIADRAQVTNASVTIYTVPANSILLLHNISCIHNKWAAAGGYASVVSSSGALIYEVYYNSSPTINGVYISNVSFPVPLEMSAAQRIQVYSGGANSTFDVSFLGTLVNPDLMGN